jgi:ribosomal protein S18 acetylase RimI-like enzyme
MPLPILSHQPRPTNEDLVRFFHRCELHWGAQLAEQTTLDVGTALTNPQLPGVWDANRMMEASLPDGMSATEAVALVSAHFAAQGAACTSWTMAPAAPADRIALLCEHLLSLGHVRRAHDILYLTGRPRGAIEEIPGLTIIPARASFRHARALAEQSAAEVGYPQLADGCMLHLEDPATDALLALENNTPRALVAVLSAGEVGCIELLYVAASHRRRGIGRTMMSRALEICARSLFKHVFLECDAADAAAASLYAKLGFERVGEYVSYRAPSE